MCVIEQKIHRHSDGRRSKKEKVRYCHEGRRRGTLCDHVERQDTGSAPLSEAIASSSSRPPSSADIITTGRDGKERQYFRVSRNGTKRSSLEASDANLRQSLDGSPAPSSSTTREVRPSTSHGDRRHRRSIKYSYNVAPEQSRSAPENDDSIYERPPSLERIESGDHTVRQQASPSARVTEVSTTQRPSQRKPRPSAIIVDTAASMTDTASSINRMSPGLSNLPRVNRFSQDLAEDLLSTGSRGKYHARVDSIADEDDLDIRSIPEENEPHASLEREPVISFDPCQQERVSHETETQDLSQARLERERMAESERRQAHRLSRQRDEEQARIERDRLAESDRRQSDRLSRQAQARDEDQARRERDRLAESDRRQRLRQSQEAEAQARARAEEAERERHRQDTAAALERSEEEAEYQRRIAAEYAQVARERSFADAHHAHMLAASANQYYEPRSMPVSPHRISYTTVPASPISARQMTNTYLTNPPTISTRPISARHSVAVHNSNNYYSSSNQRDSIGEHGDAVIARERQVAAAAAARNRTRRLSTSMGRMELQDHELDAVIDASIRRSQPDGGYERERERVRRYERQQQYY